MTLRIAHVISSDANIGGAERVLGALVRYGLTHDQEQLILRPLGSSSTEADLAGIVGGVTVRSADAHARSPASLVRAMYWTTREIRRFRPDVVHAHLGHAGVLVALMPAGRVARVLTHHHGDALVVMGRRIQDQVERVSIRRYDRIVAVSGAVAEFLTSHYSLPPARVVRIANGWEGSPVPSTPSGATIVSVANLRAEKGHETLIRALPFVARAVPSVELLLVGDGPLRPRLDQLAREVDVRNRVVFIGSVDDVWKYLASAVLFVQPSYSEPLGIAVMEAMAAGLPVVASAVGGLVELVGPDTGALVPPRNPQLLAEAMIGFLTSPERSRLAGARGHERAKSWKMETMAKRYDDLYREIVRT